ncbi:hypothetical protein ACH4UY_04995 [Streptomyces longwoodensis]|uniref:hypothetical protein n=1 Tax=Streptomyces longwoodensis TaxID=68231 RepID=UPI0037A1FB71
MDPQPVRERIDAVQYDGTNGEFIGTEFLSRTRVDSDDGEVLQLIDDAIDPLVRKGCWVVRRAQGGGRFEFLGVFSQEDYEERFAPLT